MSLGFFALLAAVVVFGLFVTVWLITLPPSGSGPMPPRDGR